MSYVFKTEAKEPFTNEKLQTPTHMIKEQKILSIELFPFMSPYPTVVMVYTVQYIAAMYMSTDVTFSC